MMKNEKQFRCVWLDLLSRSVKMVKWEVIMIFECLQRAGQEVRIRGIVIRVF